MTAPIPGRWSIDAGLDVRNVPVQVSAASYAPWSRGGWLLGYVLSEATGAAPATVNIFDGQGVGGVLLASHTISAGGSIPIPPRLPGWPLTIGLFLDIVAGAVTGSFTLGTVAT